MNGILPQSNILSKNRRSQSIISQQNSKRTSLSSINLNINSAFDNSPISNTKLHNNNNKRQSHPHQSSSSSLLHPSQKPDKQRQKQKLSNKSSSSKKLEQQQTVILQKIKKQLIETYRIVKKHYKQTIFTFNELQLKQVYQGLSNSLKNLQKYEQGKTINLKRLEDNFMKKQSNVNSHLRSCSDYQDPTLMNFKNNGNSIITNSFLSINQSNNKCNCQQSYLQKINLLQAQIQQLKQKNSQQIRQMIQNHQQQMMFFQGQQTKKVTQIKKEYEKQIQLLLKAHKKRQDQIKAQIVKKSNDQMKAKLDMLKKEEEMKINLIKKQIQEKESKYKDLLKNLLGKISFIKQAYDNLEYQSEQKIRLLKEFIKKITKSFSSYKENINLTNVNAQKQNQQFLKLVYQKINKLSDTNGIVQKQNGLEQSNNSNNFKNPKDKEQKIQNQYIQSYTQAIEQMFYRSGDQIIGMEKNVYEDSMQLLIEKLIVQGFFSEQNQENINRLINLGKSIGRSQQYQQPLWYISNAIISSDIYPLILQKIKITLSKLSQQNPNNYCSSQKSHKSQKQFTQMRPPLDSKLISAGSSNKKETREFNNSKNIANNANTPYRTIIYRNIQSIQQLDVSDSFFGAEKDDQLFQCQKFQKEKQIKEDNFPHSPIRNYEGYETPQKDIMDEDLEEEHHQNYQEVQRDENEENHQSSASFNIDDLE